MKESKIRSLKIKCENRKCTSFLLDGEDVLQGRRVGEVLLVSEP